LILKQSVPFVAKYPDIPAPVERITTEAAFYRVTRSHAAIARYMPVLLDFDPDNHLLAMEDLGRGADFSDVYQQGGGADLEKHLPSLVSWLNALHAIKTSGEDACLFANADMRALNHAHIFEIPFHRDNGIDLDAITPGLKAVAASVSRDDKLVAKVQALGEMYLGRYDSAAGRVLLHGDYYPGSWLREPDTGVRVIDPEFTFLGPPEFDVGVLMAHLYLARWETPSIDAGLSAYQGSERFSWPLAKAFAGVEIIRRLLGVAQLPVAPELDTKRRWLNRAFDWLAVA
jgi:5-methylthioribose kinase